MARATLTPAIVGLALALAAPEARAQESRWLTFFSVRPMLGAALVIPGAPPIQGEFAADVTVGLRIFRQRRDGRAWLLAPEVGFSPLKRSEDVTVLWHAGVAIGYGTVPLHVAWAPRFVLGAVGERGAYGVRNGVMLTALAGLVCAELAYQYLWTDGDNEHDLRMTVGVDVGMLVHVLMRSISDLSRW